MSEAQQIPEKPGIEPEQRRGLESMMADFEPAKDPGGEPIAAEGPKISSGEMCATCLTVVFGIIAGRRGGHWNLTPDEATQLGEATGAVLDKYCPDIEGGPEYTLIVAAGLVVLPRVMADKQLAEKEAANDGDQSTSSPAE